MAPAHVYGEVIAVDVPVEDYMARYAAQHCEYTLEETYMDGLAAVVRVVCEMLES